MGRRRAALLVGGGALLLMLVVWSASAPLQLWSDVGRDGGSPEFDLPPVEIEPAEAEFAEIEFDEPEQAADRLGTVLAIVTIIFAVCIAALVAFAIWRRVRQLLNRERKKQRRVIEFPEVVDVVEAVAEATDPADPQLTRGSPRNAIVACWMRLCAAVEASGLRPDPAETSTELTQRVLATYALDRQPVAELAALYREARFSDHELSEAERQRAIALLADVHSQFRLALEVQRQLDETDTDTGADTDAAADAAEQTPQ